MSLDKAIAHGKEHRKPYTGSKKYDRYCRNHGLCKWCEENRRFKFRDKHPADKEDKGQPARGDGGERMSEKSNTYTQISFPTYQCLVCEKFENPNALVADTGKAWLCPECKRKLRKMMEVSEDA